MDSESINNAIATEATASFFKNSFVEKHALSLLEEECDRSWTPDNEKRNAFIQSIKAAVNYAFENDGEVHIGISREGGFIAYRQNTIQTPNCGASKTFLGNLLLRHPEHIITSCDDGKVLIFIHQPFMTP